jgi:hypothetical protein
MMALPVVTKEKVDAQARQEMWQAALASTFGMWAGRDDVAQDGVEYVREQRRN